MISDQAESRSESMDAQALYMYQRNPNDRGPNLPPRPNGGNNGNNGGPPRNNGLSLLVRSLIIIGIVLVVWYLFQYFFVQSANNNNPNIVEIPYSTFYQQVQAGNVKDVTFQGQDVNGALRSAITVQ